MKIYITFILILFFYSCNSNHTDHGVPSFKSKSKNRFNKIINPRISEGTFDQDTDSYFIETPGLPNPKGFQDLNILSVCKKNKMDFINALKTSTNYLNIHPNALKFSFPFSKYSNADHYIRPYRKTYQYIKDDLNRIENIECRNIVINELSDMWDENSKYFIENFFHIENNSTKDFLHSNRLGQTLDILSDSHKYGVDILAPDGLLLQEEKVINPLISNLVRLEMSMMDKFYKINQNELATDYSEKLIHQFRVDLVDIILNHYDLSPIVTAYFMGKAISPYIEKLERAILFQDIICKMQKKECREELVHTALFKTVDLFSSLFDRDQFLDKWEKYSTFLPKELLPFFKVIKNSEANFFKMVSYIKSCEEQGYSKEVIHSYAGDLITIRNRSKDFIENTKIGGLFSGKAVNEINFTFNDKTDDYIMELFKENIKKLEYVRDRNADERIKSLENYTHIVDTNDLKSKFTNEIVYQEKVIFNKNQEMLSLQQIIKSDRKMLANYILNFDDIVSIVDAKNKSIGIDVLTKAISIAPKSEGGINLSRDRESFISGEKGDLLTFQVQGNETWSPVCALKKEGFRPEDYQSAKIGPEGFTVRYTKGRAKIDSISDSTSKSTFTESMESSRYCSEYFNGRDGKETGVRCSGWDSGTRSIKDHQEIASTSNQENREWVLNSGYRSSFTPFPLFPVGSVLLLEMPREETDYHKAKKVVVLNQLTSFLVTESSDFYLVANDCSVEENRYSNSLPIIIKKSTPESHLAQIFKENLLNSINYIKEKSGPLILSGQISGVEVDKLYADIENRFFLISEGEDIYKNEIFRGLFSIIVKTEISIIERLSRIDYLSKLIEEENVKLKNLYLNIERLDRMSEFYKKVNSFFINTHFTPSLIDEFNRYTQFITSLLLPMLGHKSPDIFKAVLQKTEIIKYKNNIEFDLLKLVHQIIELSNRIIDEISIDKLIDAPPKEQLVVIEIPRVDKKDISAKSVEDYFSLDEGIFQQIDFVNAISFWDAVNTGSSFDLNLSYSDIYSNKMASLTDRATYPVIKSMAIYLVNPSEDFAKMTPMLPDIWVNIDKKSTYYFDSSEKEEYFILPDKLRVFTIKTIVGDNENMIAHFKQWNKNSGKGFSPFSTFKFDLKNILPGKKGKSILNSVYSVRIIFDISYR